VLQVDGDYGELGVRPELKVKCEGSVCHRVVHRCSARRGLAVAPPRYRRGKRQAQGCHCDTHPGLSTWMPSIDRMTLAQATSTNCGIFGLNIAASRSNPSRSGSVLRDILKGQETNPHVSAPSLRWSTTNP
jgi:hypothetical protein